jgi:hypothetical protein
LRNIIEIGFGVLFAIGAVFNALYTFSHGSEFFGSFAENAILAPARTLVRNVVIPNSKVFTVLMIVFQLAVAASILSRGALAGPGLIAGALFAFGAAWVSSPGGALANLAMAVVMAYLALTR